MRYSPCVVRRLALLSFALVACSRPRDVAPAPLPAASAEVDAAAPPVTNAPPPPQCDETAKVTLFTSPRHPWKGAPLRVVAISDKPIEAELRAWDDGSNETSVDTKERRGGPPYSWVLELPSPRAASWHFDLVQTTCAMGKGGTSDVVTVAASPRPRADSAKEKLWTSEHAWNRGYENMYSAWIEALFDAPDAEQPSWPALHEVLRDPKRNFLHDHLGLGEDSAKAPVVRPDCADLPYFLRAYFAWKLGLPFGVAECNRGGGGLPPSCKNLITNEDPDERAARARDSVAAFGSFLGGTLADKAHSGSARTPFEDEASDYYPVPISWDSLRPGTVYADPYGHVLVVAKRVKTREGAPAVLYAVDGQPDGTVARKRFWRGNFLFAKDPALGGPGWKRFRPVARRGGALARLDDRSILGSAEYGDLSREPGKLDVEAFYDAMEDVLAPQPVDPEVALMDVIASLEEQVRTRVKSVDNGRKWLAKGEPPVTMPEGASIFEALGTWEDFSTPSRDLRLLIAIDVVSGFPGRVARRPQRFAMPAGKNGEQVKTLLENRLARELASRNVTYTRTDGSTSALSLAEVLARSAALEVAYNPNDCVELRWGAPPGSDEGSTCRGHAPAEQRARMEQVRDWFRQRRRPPRK